jgi:uncharacterized protein
LIRVNSQNPGAIRFFKISKEPGMSNTPHTLSDEFPDQLVAIHALKVADSRFAKLLRDYDDINDKVHRAETRIDAVTEDVERALRKQRLTIKDAIALALAKAG